MPDADRWLRTQALLADRSPRRYGVRPTPVHRLDRFSAAIGRGPGRPAGGDVWIKRDDLVSVGLGGNKVRKLDHLVADALAHGADHLVTVGAEQSNHARCVAAVASIEGLGCDLVLGTGGASAHDAPTGNLLLDHLFGATIHHPGTDDWATLEAASHEVADQLRRRGKRPYVMPIGGSTPVGALGFVAAYAELRAQLAAAGVVPSAIVHATSSGGTQAGLVVGAAAAGDPVAIVGIGVAKTAGDLTDEVMAIAAGTASLLGLDAGELDTAARVLVLDGYLGEAYAAATAGSTDALMLLARTEGIVVDPVYTAKALHAVVEPPAGALGDALVEGPVVFWHTGGLPALFAPHHSAPLLGGAR